MPRFVDANGYRYELRDLRTAAGTPYLLSYGTSDDVGAGDVFMRLNETGATRGVLASGEDVSTVERTARATGTATLRVAHGKPTRGRLILAIYTPVR